MKVFHAHVWADPAFRVRFRRECEALVALEHPHIIPVYDAGEASGRGYLVMRLARGGSLADRLAAGPLTPREATAVLAQVAAALDAAHAAGRLHRDLKPGNVLLRAGRARLAGRLRRGPDGLRHHQHRRRGHRGHARPTWRPRSSPASRPPPPRTATRSPASRSSASPGGRPSRPIASRGCSTPTCTAGLPGPRRCAPGCRAPSTPPSSAAWPRTRPGARRAAPPWSTGLAAALAPGAPRRRWRPPRPPALRRGRHRRRPRPARRRGRRARGRRRPLGGGGQGGGPVGPAAADRPGPSGEAVPAARAAADELPGLPAGLRAGVAEVAGVRVTAVPEASGLESAQAIARVRAALEDAGYSGATIEVDGVRGGHGRDPAAGLAHRDRAAMGAARPELERRRRGRAGARRPGRRRPLRGRPGPRAPGGPSGALRVGPERALGTIRGVSTRALDDPVLEQRRLDALSQIRQYGDPVLRTPAEAVAVFDDELRAEARPHGRADARRPRRRPRRAADRPPHAAPGDAPGRGRRRSWPCATPSRLAQRRGGDGHRGLPLDRRGHGRGGARRGRAGERPGPDGRRRSRSSSRATRRG